MKLSEPHKDLVRNAPFFIGLILNLVVVRLFSKTVITTFMIILLYAVPGLVACLLVQRVKSVDTNVLIRFVYASVSFGSPLTAALLLLNFNIHRATGTEIVHTKILKTGFTAKTHSPTAEVEVEGVVKQFVFPGEKQLNDYPMLLLELQEGILGWKIVREKKLTKSAATVFQ